MDGQTANFSTHRTHPFDVRERLLGAHWGECAFPILLIDLLLREKMLEPSDADRFTEMVMAAAGFIVRNGPATRQDRWEEDGGYSPFTLSVTVTALLAAANFLERRGVPAHTIQYLREDDVDPSNPAEVLWAMATRVHPARYPPIL
jgi:glucoamylase